MGSSASYRVGLTLVTKRTLKIDTINSEEEIDKFLKKKKGSFGKPVALKELEHPSEDKITDGTYLSYMFVGQLDWDDEPRNVFSHEYETFDKFLEDIDIYCEDDVFAIKAMTRKELSKVNLEILKEYEILEKNVDSYEGIAGDYNEIYCDNDNSVTEKIKLTPKQLEDLAAKRAYLELYGDGNAYC